VNIYCAEPGLCSPFVATSEGQTGQPRVKIGHAHFFRIQCGFFMSDSPRKSGESAKPRPHQRMSLEAREEQIVQGAIKFFSERGLDGQTRDLAKEIGITHPLLYHYFPTKQSLIERVYQEVYLGRWKPEWEEWLDDPQTDLETKLNRFYQDYSNTVLTPEWVRILIFSGLNDGYISGQYMALLGEKLLPRLLRETRRHLGVSLRKKTTERENELIWGLHGGIFYLGIRRHIYKQAPSENPQQVVQDRVTAYLAGARALFADE
jgi:AcrR family transcriptional regulator